MLTQIINSLINIKKIEKIKKNTTNNKKPNAYKNINSSSINIYANKEECSNK